MTKIFGIDVSKYQGGDQLRQPRCSQVGTADEQICKELCNRKLHLNNDYENKRALKTARELCT